MATHVRFSAEDVKKVIESYSNLSLNEEKNKVVCSLTGHEMPCREDAITSYINGKRFQKAKARDSSNYEKYKPHLVPSTKKYHENQLFCMLTLRHINKTPAHVERHVNGARYKRALARWQECMKKGIKFVPNRRRKDKEETADKTESGEESGADNSEDEKEDQNEDDLEDLYPAEDFKEGEENEDSDYDFESSDMKPDINHIDTQGAGTAKQGTKRKGEMKKPKLMKKKKQKVG